MVKIVSWMPWHTGIHIYQLLHNIDRNWCHSEYLKITNHWDSFVPLSFHRFHYIILSTRGMGKFQKKSHDVYSMF